MEDLQTSIILNGHIVEQEAQEIHLRQEIKIKEKKKETLWKNKYGICWLKGDKNSIFFPIHDQLGKPKQDFQSKIYKSATQKV
jgi:hypothetical protein